MSNEQTENHTYILSLVHLRVLSRNNFIFLISLCGTMHLKHSMIRLLLLLFYKALVTAKTFKFKINDKNQPFIVNIQYDEDVMAENRQYLFSAPPPDSSDNENIKFVSYSSTSLTNLLKSYCPSEDPDSEFSYILYQNSDDRTTCSQVFRPSMYYMNDELSYGVNGDGKKYSIGYWVNWNQNGVLYTTHIIYPGTEITLDSWISIRGTTLFKGHGVDYPTNYDESMIQLVPFEDLIPMPWKIGTLININFIYVSDSIKSGFNIINECLRSHVNNTKNPLTVFSGVVNNAWYWKVVGNGDAEAVMICVTNSEGDNYSTPCDVGNCQEFGLGILENRVSNIYCCEVTQQISAMLNLVSYGPDQQPDYMTFEGKLQLSPTCSDSSVISANKKKPPKRKLSFSLSRKNFFS